MTAWRLSWRADPTARVIADRHYNRQKPGTDQMPEPTMPDPMAGRLFAA